MKEFRVTLPNRPGQLAGIAELLGERGINIKSVAGVADSPHPAVALVVEDVGQTRTALREGRFQFEEKEILTATLPDRPGELGQLARKLGNSGVNIESIYVLETEGENVQLALSVDNPKKAKEILG